MVTKAFYLHRSNKANKHRIGNEISKLIIAMLFFVCFLDKPMSAFASEIPRKQMQIEKIREDISPVKYILIKTRSAIEWRLMLKSTIEQTSDSNFVYVQPANPEATTELPTNDLDFTDIQNAIDHALSDDESFQFDEYVTNLVNGDESFSVQGVIKKALSLLVGELKANSESLVKLLTIAVIAAVFTNFSHTFQNSQVAETGFYVTYLLMFVILASTFINATSIASQTVIRLLDFMKALVPTYCMTVAFCTGATTSVLYYEGILVLITLVNVVLLKVIVPLSNIYMMATLADNITSEDTLTKLAELLATVIKWILKTLLAVVIGIGTVQSLIAPAIDQVKRSSVMKVTEMIPGLGSILGGVTETVLGAGVLLKNCVGVAGMVAVLIICAIPLIKLVIYVFIYKVLAAAIQPISDKRIVNCVSACAQATGLLLQTVFVAAVLFEIVITIVAVSTMKAL